MVGLLRWAVDVQLEKPHLKFWHWQRSAAILTLVGIAFILGYLHKMPVEWIISLKAANSLVQAGLEAKSFSEFPEGLNEKHMENFSTYASHNYKLEVNNSLQGLFGDAYPGLEIEFRDNIVIIYFESGQDIACLISIADTNKCLPIHRKIKLGPFL